MKFINGVIWYGKGDRILMDFDFEGKNLILQDEPLVFDFTIRCNKHKQKDFYLGVLGKDSSAVQDVFRGMIEDDETSDIYGGIKEEIDGLIVSEEEESEPFENE